MNSKPQKILLTCFDNVGDLVFISSLSANLSRNFPDCEIHIWCKEYTSQLGMLLPGVTKLFASDPYWDKSPLRPKGSRIKFLKMWWAVRSESYDLAIITGACWRSALFSRLASIPIRIGYNRSKARYFLNRKVPMFSRDKAVVSELLRLLSPLNIDQPTAYYQLQDPKNSQVTHPKSEFIALHPFAGHPRRCASLEFWHQLAQEIKAKGLKIIWIGASHEVKRIKDLYNYAQDEFIQTYLPEDNLYNVATFIQRSRLFIGHDSGPLHVATALKVPTLGFYLPSEHKRTFPQGPIKTPWIVEESPTDLKLEKVLKVLDESVLAKTIDHQESAH